MGAQGPPIVPESEIRVVARPTRGFWPMRYVLSSRLPYVSLRGPQCSGRQGPDCESTAHAQAGSARGRGSMASEVVWVADSIAPKMAILGRFVRFLAPTMAFPSLLDLFPSASSLQQVG